MDLAQGSQFSFENEICEVKSQYYNNKIMLNLEIMTGMRMKFATQNCSLIVFVVMMNCNHGNKS